MSNQVSAPRPREISSDLEAIRARWSNAKRRERRQAAQHKQRQLARCLAGVANACQKAD